MRYMAVTGTNGKTTVHYLAAQLLTQAGEKVGLVGTLGAGTLENLVPTGYTTPDAKTHTPLWPKLELAGCTWAILEASSHGLIQQRLKGIPIEIAAFTNLTHDHLDYHKTMAAYAEAKALLFKTPKLKLAIVNADDPYAEQIIQHTSAAEIIRIHPSRAQFQIEAKGFLLEKPLKASLPLMGEYNIANTLIALAMARSVHPEFNFDLSKLRAPSGRMEMIPLESGAMAVIDYAHTPDALEKALIACRQHCLGKLWVVFGCGGDRDRAKRPLMAKAADTYADQIIVTEDNARFEAPEQIFADICEGFERDYRLIPERAKAIQAACQNAQSGDVILLAGKGHERYLDIQGEQVFFDEREWVSS